METTIEAAVKMAIVGRAKCCKRLVFASSDEPQYAKSNAKEVAKLVRDGYQVETITAAEVRSSEWFCECKKNAPAANSETGGVTNGN